MVTARSATILLCHLFPSEDLQQSWDGWHYLQGDVLERARSLLWGEQGIPDWPPAVRQPGYVYDLFQRAKESIPTVESTIRIYGPALFEHPDVLQALESFVDYTNDEQLRWNQFWRSHQDATEELREWQLARLEARETLPLRPEPKVPLAPQEALMNMRNIGALALNLAIEATRVVGDRNDLLDEMPQLRITTMVWSAQEGYRETPYWPAIIAWNRQTI